MGSSSTNYAITEMDTKKNTSGAAAVLLLIIRMMSVMYGAGPITDPYADRFFP